MDNGLLPDIEKIAVFRPSALGDLIFALPALDALRAAYPRAEIVYLGRDWHTTFLPGRLSGPHRVIAIPHARNFEQILQGLIIDPDLEPGFFAAMQAEHFDLALQMHGSGRTSNTFLLNMRPGFTAGLRGVDALPLDRWFPYLYYQNETARLLEVAALVGAGPPPGGLEPCLPVLDGDLSAAADVLETTHGPFVVLHTGSTDPRRSWSPDRFAVVGDYCADQGLAVILIGTAMEAERIQAVVDRMRAPVRNLCDQLSLPGMVGLLSRASLFVGNDSGPLHIAHAVGTRAAGLFWVEYIVNSLPLSRGRFYPLIAWQRTCPRCGRYCEKAEIDAPSGPCTHDVSFIEEITPADVIQGIQVLLAAG
jgi:ADP-heptose:LPS heptosyltransferase